MILKTEETRVWRTYHGGAGLDRWQGREGKDGFFPEDWAASTTRAFNAGREEIVEGLSRVVSMEGKPYFADVAANDPVGVFGRAHVDIFGAQAGFLVKLIDSSERLGIQVHPDKTFARDYLHSAYGKTESWYIIGGNGCEAEPCIYLGFKPGVTREMWKEIFNNQDIPAMLDCLHKIPVYPGDCWFISAGVPHAIGRGCFLAEVQEPTDYTMRTELVTPGGLKINERQCHQGVGYEKMLDCFHYDALSLEETRARWQCFPVRVDMQAGGRVDSLIDNRQTDLFSMQRLTVTDALKLPAQGRMSILIALSGCGFLEALGEKMAFRRGEVFVLRADCTDVTVRTDGEEAQLLRSFSPKP